MTRKAAPIGTAFRMLAGGYNSAEAKPAAQTQENSWNRGALLKPLLPDSPALFLLVNKLTQAIKKGVQLPVRLLGSR